MKHSLGKRGKTIWYQLERPKVSKGPPACIFPTDTKGCLQRRVKYPVSKTETFSLCLIVPVQEQKLKAITTGAVQAFSSSGFCVEGVWFGDQRSGL